MDFPYCDIFRSDIFRKGSNISATNKILTAFAAKKVRKKMY